MNNIEELKHRIDDMQSYLDELKTAIQREKEIIRVPDNIKIYKSDLIHVFGDGLFIGFNNNQQFLGYNGLFKTYTVSCPSTDYKEIPCKLIPCDREDLEAGDTAYYSDETLVDPIISDLCKIIDNDSFVSIVFDGGVQTYKLNYEYWYKVEPI